MNEDMNVITDITETETSDITAIASMEGITQDELLAVIAVTLDDIKMLLIALIAIFIIFKVVRWSS